MFRYRLLIGALRTADPAAATDEARAIEGLGLKPRLVLGDTRNIKVTFPEDLLLAELIIRGREGKPPRKRSVTKGIMKPPRRQKATRSRTRARPGKK
jgi:hypothetical protein